MYINSNLNANFLKNKKNLLVIVPAIVFVFLVITISFKYSSMPQQKNLFGYLHEFAVIFIGCGLLFWGFKELMVKRLIENTPTSKIRSVAMGIAEIVGLARLKYPLKSPLTYTECAYYRYLIERENTDSKGRKYWVKEEEGSSSSYFYIEDTTGKILVDPLNAEIMLIRDYQNIESHRFARKRYTEWTICSGDYVYVLGTVKKFKNMFEERKIKLNEKLQALKQDAKKMKEFDKDGDGEISIDEWDNARAKAEIELLEEELNKPKENEDDIVIGKGDFEKTFIISDRDEKEVAGKKIWSSMLGIFFGIVIISLISYSVLNRAEIIKNGWTIPWGSFYGFH
ncbi:MAG: GIDE domain-containing protein [Elusimicrobia bacterium]|nr:GIDE domain-containing protein [Elusimicrobiota bacterium]